LIKVSQSYGPYKICRKNLKGACLKYLVFTCEEKFQKIHALTIILGKEKKIFGECHQNHSCMT